MLPRVPGIIVDNEDVVYQFDGDPNLSLAEQLFNDGVARVSADPQSRRPNGLAQLPIVSGDIDVPVLTLHNLGDLFVPVHNEIEYASRVAAQGKSDLLVQRAIRGVLHCDFTPAEFGAAFLDLVTWVRAHQRHARARCALPVRSGLILEPRSRLKDRTRISDYMWDRRALRLRCDPG